jgi:glycosyltransferase involved in cell wall biosynthesis
MKIAWFTPFRRDGSGIANFSDSICGALREDHEVVVFASDLADGGDARRTDVEVVGLLDADPDRVRTRLAGIPLVVYNLGNYAPYHARIYEYLQRHPGLVVLHDLVMRDFFIGYYLGEGRWDRAGLLRAMEYGHGPQAAEWLGRLLEGRIEDLWADPNILDYHMARAAVCRAHGVVVHSEYSRSRVAEFAGAPVAKVAFPAPPLAATALGWDPPGDPVGRPVNILTFGHVNRNKRVDLVIEAIGTSPTLRGHVAYTVAGALNDAPYTDHLRRLVEHYHLADAVRLIGHLPDAPLHEAIRAADVLVVLRNPHLGESSWSLLESLFAAKPTVVWDHGSYAEFPDRVVRKVSSREELTSALEALCRNAEYRRDLGERARRYAVQTFDSRRYGRDLIAFADAVREHRVVLGLADRIARMVREMGPGPESHLALRRAAEEIGDLAADDKPDRASVEV